MNIEVRRPFRKEDRKARFRATYQVTDVPEPGCVQVTVTLATRIQLSQQIMREGVKYTEVLLGECTKELVRRHVEKGGKLDPNCGMEPADDAIFLDYGDFDLLVATALRLTEEDED
ncbi:hypothetical protein BH23ACT12_BH23ACT12_12890 [soil metagenome]